MNVLYQDEGDIIGRGSADYSSEAAADNLEHKDSAAQK
jgi:hypothetical protein